MTFIFNPFTSNFDGIGSISTIPNLSQTLKSQGWSVISTRPTFPTGLDSHGKVTSFTLGVAPFPFEAVRLCFGAFGTFNGLPDQCSSVPLWIRAAIQDGNAAAPGDLSTVQIAPVLFNGKELHELTPGNLVLSDPQYFNKKTGDWWYTRSSSQGDCLPVAPAAPTLSQSATGGHFSNSSVVVGISYVYSGGSESRIASASITLTGGTSTQSITVTSPSAVSGVIGYRVFVAAQGSAALTDLLYEQGAGIVPIGTNTSLSQLSLAVGRSASTVNFGLVGGSSQGGTGASASNNGESVIFNTDGVPRYSVLPANSGAHGFAPLFALGLTPQGIQPSLGIWGDSIMNYLHDEGFGFYIGGYAWRAAANQTTNRAYNPQIVPLHGMSIAARSGDTAKNNATGDVSRRRQLLSICTTVYCDLGTNDLLAGTSAIAIIYYLSLIANNMLGMGINRFVQGTIFPKTNTSTDFWSTLAGQSYTVGSQEAMRRQLNNVLRSKSLTVANIQNEAMMIASSGALAGNYNFQSGGDGSTLNFVSLFPFVQGTEVIKVNGVTKGLNTDYTYYGAQIINGVSYASGVSFGGAPGSGLPVTASYTSSPGWMGFLNYNNAVIFDVAAVLEVNSAGQPVLNGGLWPADNSNIVGTRTSTAISNTSITDSTLTLTQDQYRGYTVRIVSDATTPASVGQILVITGNTTTGQINVSGFDTTPSVGATFLITDLYTVEGTHPTTRSHMLVSQAFAAANLIV